MNPYSPPKSSQAESSSSLAPRPASIWLLMVFLTAMTVLLAAGTARFLWFLASHLTEIRNFSVLVLPIGWRIATVVASSVVALGVFQRKQWARWLGLLALAGFAALSILSPDTTAYSNDAQRIGGFFARSLIIPALIGWWAYACAFSNEAKCYFARL